ncbi:MAG: signal recognition particle-docking protein FtsY [Pseudomonadota bacterium]|nr:signal recognition particle-docking protein FtsY [Pseudomonadota bacterium]
MSFLSKLKERLLKTSSKIKEGVDALLTEAETNQEEEDHSDYVTENQQKISEQRSNEASDTSSVSVAKNKNRTLIGKLKKNVEKPKKRLVDDAMLEGLEDLLISSDLGVATAVKISAAFSDLYYGRRLSAEEIKSALAGEIKRILDPVATPISILSQGLQVILVVGVNGSGKTTTIGKLAKQFKTAGKKVKIVAGDTFRAAAVEQLEIWGDRVGVAVVKASEGSDPAALSFDAISTAEKEETDILLIDTAGRLQNKTDLMQELAKIVRVIKKAKPGAPHSTLLVLDASIGQNAINQVEIFQQTAHISGLIMTKLDGTAKGGILVTLADKFRLPIHAIGIGENIEDLQPFDPEEFTLAVTGASNLEFGSM